MWNRAKDFYNSNKYAIWWTVGYVATVWVIMRYMFNFDIFSMHRWHQLMSAHLHGFAGLVFGILVLAMVPLYVATTVVIARNHAPLFNIKIPQFIKNAFTQKPMPEPEVTKTESTPVATTKPETNQETVSTISHVNKTIPSELRVAYARAREKLLHSQSSAFSLGNIMAPATDTPTSDVSTDKTPDLTPEIPIPTDFDIDKTSKIINDDTPMFTDIDFDDDEEDDDDDDTINDNNEIGNIQTDTGTNDTVINYLHTQSIPFKKVDDVVVTDRFAIVSHTDSDFWIADDESWFAAGKIRKSPITSVQAVAAAHHVEPVLYMTSNNIMDIDTLREKWESNGIRIITDLNDIG